MKPAAAPTHPLSSEPLLQESQGSSVDLIIADLAAGIFSADLLIVGLVFLGWLTLPFSWPCVLNGGAIIAASSAIVFLWANTRGKNAPDPINDSDPIEDVRDLPEEDEFERYVAAAKAEREEGLIGSQIDDPEDTGAGLGNGRWVPKRSSDFKELNSKSEKDDDLKDSGFHSESPVFQIEEEVSDFEELYSESEKNEMSKEEDLGFQDDMDCENLEKTDCNKQQQIFKHAAIAEWRSIGAQISSDPEKTLPLLLGSRLDVFLEAFCKNQNSDSNLPIVDYIAQASPNGQPNDIAAYEWKSSQKYLLFCLGIVGLISRNPFDVLTHVAGGGSIEGHQTLVVIDRSNSEKPILWFYDPKGRDPNGNQKDAMAPVKTIPQRLEEIRKSFKEKFGTNIQQKQLNVGKLHNLRGDADQSIFNKNHCVYLCAGAAMDIVLGKESDFSRDPKKIVYKINEEISRAFPEAGLSE